MVIDGKALATTIIDGLRDEVEKLTFQPHLVVLMVGENWESEIYVKQKRKACEKIGIKLTELKFPDNTTETALLNEIQRLNEDSSVHGIILQQPITIALHLFTAQSAILPRKDVDGFHFLNWGMLYVHKHGFPVETFIPCTPLGCLRMMESISYNFIGKNAVVIGRSTIVGKPMALLLLQKDTTVTICHSRTKEIDTITKNADLLIVAAGEPHLITKDMVKDGVGIIDVGINRVSDSTTEKGYKIVGDVDFEAVKNKASFISAVPGGVGPMTVAMLMENTVKAAQRANV